jgi:hypothetical protein
VKIPASAKPLLDASLFGLHRALRAGHPIDEASLDDTEYLGISVGMPRFVEKLTWKTFTKTFHRDPDTRELRGWNVRMEQTGIEGEAIPVKRGDEPFTWGHYRVYAEGRGMMIDYGVPGNPFFVSRMRDPLVAVTPDDPSVLLGVSYFDLGLFRLLTPTYFVLVRRGPLTHHAAQSSR